MTELEHITAEEAISAGGGESILLDVREQHEWDAGHAPHAQSLPMSQLESRVGELSQDATLLVICRSGQRSLRVATALSEAGYHVVNVLGGMLAWQEAGGELVAEGGEPPRV
jgi:rhodanese-related sulfurtransferase